MATLAIAFKALQWYFARPIWLDEEMLLLNVRDRALSDLPGALWLNQTAPLGWLAVEHVLVAAFNGTDRAVRALPVAFGIATIITATWFALRRLTLAGAMVLVGLMAFGQWMSFYALEAKPYSADAFWAFLLPVLLIWTLEPGTTPATFVRRSVLWWCGAALGQWFGYGAVFVTPACALLLCATAWRRGRWRLAAAVALPGLIWLACFGVHYQTSIRYAKHSQYLYQYWWWGFPPAGAGFLGTCKWFLLQLKPLAAHPGGTSYWVRFWLLAAYGFGVATWRRTTFGLALLCVPLSAIVLSALRVVPVSDRLALWLLPVVYTAIAIASDDAVAQLRAGIARRDWKTAVFGLAIALLVVQVAADILERGYDGMASFQSRGNHGLDDSSAMRFLTAQHQRGDVFLTVHLGLPALWWYGHISVAAPNYGERNLTDGTPLFEAIFTWPGGKGCRAPGQKDELRASLAGVRRVAVYLGFDSRNPPSLQELILDRLSELGQMVAYRRVSEDGVAAVFDLTLPAEPWSVVVRNPTGHRLAPVLRPQGCLTISPARRW